MSFTDRENLLFEEWKTVRELPFFVKDGVLDEPTWSRQSLRVLVLLPSVDREECLSLGFESILLFFSIY
ncbi:MAG: hypothetical protein CL946_06015 [Ectothiorhodospiraceae bacterium]|nr:hypothetical protein [Ectothiorhodospiraceae bacterium]